MNHFYNINLRVVIASAILGLLHANPVFASDPPAATQLPEAAANFVNSGNVSTAVNGTTLNVNQSTNNASVNWQSFDVGSAATVNFNQPNATSVILNNILQADPSRIFGALNANGRVYLLNQNGFVFGAGARINTNGLVTSTLDINEDVLERGLVFPGTEGNPAFALGENGDPLAEIKIEEGAKITGEAGSSILLFAPNIKNEGDIELADGQIILAAGDKVFLTSDQDIRGLLVEVEVGGEVTNGADSNALIDPDQVQGSVVDANEYVGRIVAERGNVTLLGMAVNQKGLVSATTAVQANGSIRLIARDQGSFNVTQLESDRSGDLKLGTNSVTEVLIDRQDTATTVDRTDPLLSSIELYGSTIELQSNSTVTANAGEVTLTSKERNANNFDLSQLTQREPNEGRIQISDGAVVDVSGLNITRSVEDNLLEVELRGDEFSDTPVQRDGPLRGETVVVDVRQRGVRDDGTEWEGTPLADVSGFIDSIGRTVEERSLNGGSITIESQGSVVIESGAELNVDGGSITYQSGNVNTTQLLRADGSTVDDISAADPNIVYAGIFEPVTGQNNFEPEYIEGKDAGSIEILAPLAYLDTNAFSGRTRIGINQRLPSLTSPAANPDRFYRPFDEAPLGGAFMLGDINNSISPNRIFRTREIVFSRDPVSIPAINEAVDPNNDMVIVSPELFTSGGFTRGAFAANRAITLPEDVALNLQPGSSLALRSSAIDLQGDIRIPAGDVDIAIASGEGNNRLQLHLGPNASVDVSGRWVNDRPLLAAGVAQGPLLIDGGSVSIDAGNAIDVNLAAGSAIDVSAGAQVSAASELNTGDAGSISFESGLFTTNPVIETTFSGYGIEGSNGGEIRFSVGTDVCITSGPCSNTSGSLLSIDLNRIAQRGFQVLAVDTTDSLEVAANQSINLRQITRQLARSSFSQPNAGFLNQRSDSRIQNFSTLINLPALFRSPVDLALSAIGNVTVLNGSSIVGDAGADIDIFSDNSVFIDGLLSAQAGNISIALGNKSRTVSELNDDDPFFDDSQAIWLGSNSVLDVSGTSQIITINNRRTGRVLDAGHVDLDADRGFIVTQSGSQIRADGASGTVDIVTNRFSNPVIANTIFSSGGSVTLEAAEGMLLDGEIYARPSSTTTLGGTLAISLNVDARGGENTITNPNFPNISRRIELTPDDSSQLPASLEFGDSIPNSLFARAIIREALAENSGVDSLLLESSNLSFLDANSSAPFFRAGEIILNDGLDLGLRRDLVLDAPLINSGGGTANLQANVLRAGFDGFDSILNLPQINLPASQAGNGQINVSANLLEVAGDLVFSNVNHVLLHSEKDLRFRGTLAPGEFEIDGSLSTAGQLDLIAQQIYATTLTDFSVLVGGADSRLTTQKSQNTSAPGAVLSAGSRLTLQADTIEHHGVLAAPAGEIRLIADNPLTGESDLILGAGSEITTAIDGLIPFGRVQIGTDYAYILDDPNVTAPPTLVFDGVDRTLPEKRISLTGNDIDIDADASLDISGGGDLFAYEFVPGVTGGVDVLAVENSENSFAILPSANLSFAPYDPQESTGSNLTPGESVFLEGALGVPTGTYVKLPARYALLPGAFLVTEVKGGDQTILSGQRFNQTDGGVIVAGRTVFDAGTFGDSALTQFKIDPQNVVLNQARYDRYNASEFFLGQQNATGNNRMRLPIDSGSLVITANSALNLQGNLRADAAAVDEALGSVLDIASSNIAVISDASQQALFDDSFLFLFDDLLNQFGAESVLLGGTRSFNDNGTALTVNAQNVTLADNVALIGNEFLFAAKSRVGVNSNSAIVATSADSANAATLLSSGDSAILGVSGVNDWSLIKTGEAGLTGTLVVADNAQLTATGSILLDASLDTQFNAQTIDASGGTVNFSAAQINIGELPAGANLTGLNLTVDDLAAIAADSLRFTSLGSVDFYGSPLLPSFRSLDIQAGGIGGFLSGGETNNVTINTDRLSLSNPRAVAFNTLPDGNGTLTVNSDQIVFGPGDFGIRGFSINNLTGNSNVTTQGEGSLQVMGELNLNTDLLTVENQSNFTLSVLGSTRIGSGNGMGSLTNLRPGSGQLLIESSGQLEMDTAVRIPAGQLTLATQDAGADVVLGAMANVDLSGIAQPIANSIIYTPGGGLLIRSAGDTEIIVGSMINVQGGGAGLADSGAIEIDTAGQLTAFDATLVGRAVDNRFQGGSFELAAESLLAGQFAQLQATLNSSGFNQRRGVSVRSGDLSLSAAESIVARDVELVTNQGVIDIAGTIDASGPEGGVIALHANNDAGNAINIAGVLDASAESEGEAGGEIFIGTTGGSLAVRSTATLDVSGGSADSGGSIYFRAPRTANDVSIDELSGSLIGSSQTIVEALAVIDNVTGIDTAFINARRAETDAYAPNLQTIANRLGLQNDPAVMVTPGIEVRSAGDLSLLADWDFSSWRFGASQVPGALTLRAANNLYIGAPGAINRASAGSLSDGFTSATSSQQIAGPSWSYRLVAGADVSSSNPLAVVNDSSAGDVRVANGTPGTSGFFSTPPALRSVRTGTGDIDIAAAGDVSLGNAQSVIYTAGVPTTGVPLASLENLPYPDQGGDISLSAGGDINGVNSGQLIVDWLWKTGGGSFDFSGQRSAVGWTVNFSQFQQNIGALGGGNVDIIAGENVNNLSVSVPQIGRQVGGIAIEDSEVETIAGGDISVVSGGSIRGGVYFAGDGSLDLVAGDELSRGTNNLYPVLAAANTEIGIHAQNDLGLETVFNPTLLPNSSSQGGFFGGGDSFFFTYTPGSSVSLFSTAGDVVLNNNANALSVAVNLEFATAQEERDGLTIYPGTLIVDAPAGEIQLDRVATLYPSPQGNVQFRALDDIVFSANSRLHLSDADPFILPGITNPQTAFNGSGVNGGVLLGRLAAGDLGPASLRHAETPIHLQSFENGLVDDEPALFASENGSIIFETSDINEGLVELSKRVEVRGNNLINPNFIVQHVRATDVSTFVAQNEINYPILRNANGLVIESNLGIVIDGPGRVDVFAGGDVNLGPSNGITTRGNMVNPVLDEEGASVNVFSGLAEFDQQQIDDFNQRYITGSQTYLDNLATYIAFLGEALIENVDGVADETSSVGEFEALEDGQLLTLFQNLDGQQLEFLYQLGLQSRLTGRFTDELVEMATPAGLSGQALVDFRRQFFADLSRLQFFSQFDFAALTNNFDSLNGLADQLNGALFAVDFNNEQISNPDFITELSSRGFLTDFAATSLLDNQFRSISQTELASLSNTIYAPLTISQQLPVILDVYNTELRDASIEALNAGNNDFSRAFAVIEGLFPDESISPADLSLFFSRIATTDGGNIGLYVPAGGVNVGISTPPSDFGVNKAPQELGIIVQSTGDVSSFSNGDFQVEESRVFVADGGDIQIFVEDGDIDAGRGAQTAISSPPPTVTVDADGNITTVFPPALTGSGIRAFVTSAGTEPGDVFLFTPQGRVIAGDAGIGTAGNITIAALEVVGADNINVGGTAVGVPDTTVTTTVSVPDAGASATSSAEEETTGSATQNDQAETIGDSALAWLDVFVLGFGDEAPAENDTDVENCVPNEINGGELPEECDQG